MCLLHDIPLHFPLLYQALFSYSPPLLAYSPLLSATLLYFPPRYFSLLYATLNSTPLHSTLFFESPHIIIGSFSTKLPLTLYTTQLYSIDSFIFTPYTSDYQDLGSFFMCVPLNHSHFVSESIVPLASATGLCLPRKSSWLRSRIPNSSRSTSLSPI